jgi:hypothetical protein
MSNDFGTNCQDADTLLKRFRNETLPHFINGKQDKGRSGKTFDSLTPVDNSIIGDLQGSGSRF